MMAIAGVTLAPVVQVRHSDAAEGPTVSISWQSAGDSYSSGEGVAGNRGDCAQSPAAYGPVAADLLRHEYGWSIPNETFTACTGAVSAEYLDRVGDPEKGTTLWQWGREQGAPERVDIITMSFGGNDIGFADALLDCLDLPATWTDLLEPEGPFRTGCDFDESDLEARIDSLLGPSTPQQQSMPDFYEQIVDRALTAAGHLYVVGYPRIFAPVSEWPGWIKVSCQGVFRGDTERLGRLADRLNDTLRDATDEVNSRIGSNRVHFVDRAAAYRDGGHELCGTGDDWLNGIALDRGDGSLRLETSFHPNAAGHAAVARVLVDQVATSYEPPAPDTGLDFDASRAWVPALCGHSQGNLVDGYLPDTLLGEPSGMDYPGYVALDGNLPTVTGDIDGDGRSEESVFVVLCTYPFTAGVPPQPETWLIVHDRYGQVYAVSPGWAMVTVLDEVDGTIKVGTVLCDPDVGGCQPIGGGMNDLVMVSQEGPILIPLDDGL